jgi:multidrug resistance efflux pump
MDKEKLEKRLAELQASLKQVEANGNALLGAIQECQYWLAQIEQAEMSKAVPDGE